MFRSGLAAGVVLGALIGYLVGKAVARALRAWRDLVATKESITGLWRRVIGEWWTVIRYTAVITLILIGVATYSLWSVLQ